MGSLLHHRASRVGAASAGAALVVLTCAGVGIAHAHKTVTISVDGATRQVTTFQSSPSRILEEAGVSAGRYDSVTPDSTTRVGAGDVITVTRATAVVADGKPQFIAEPTVAQAASALASTGPLALARDGALTHTLLGATHVVIAHDGAEDRVEVVDADTPASVLKRAGIELGPLDRVHIDVSGNEPVLVISRVSRSLDIAEETIEHETTEVKDPELEVGTRRVVEEGANGRTRQTTYTESVDGETSFSGASEVTEVEPARAAVVHVGTKPVPKREVIAASAPAPAASAGNQGQAPSGGVWAALARCESGGNPAAVSPNGLYHGLYQFSVSTWRAVGGSGLPSQASAAEQTQRAQMLQARAGWGQWPACSRSLGLR